MGYGGIGYGGYGIFGALGMIFNWIILIVLIWAVSSYFNNRSCSNNGPDERLSRIERQVESNRETLDKILKKLE